MRLLPVLAIAIAGASPSLPQAPKNVELERAKSVLEQLKFAEASRLLDAAWASGGSDRETVLEILKLQGVVASTLGQFDRARQAFRTLLYLAPDFELPEGDLGPKVISTFYEAKGRVSVETVLRFEAIPPERDEQRVHQLGVWVKADPLKLARSVRFHTRIGSQDWVTKEVALVAGKSSLPVDAPAVEWWVELLGEKERTLESFGHQGQPVRSERLVPLPPAPAASVAAASPRPNLKPVAYGVAGAGALAGVVGLVVGVNANRIRGEIEGATREADGAVSGITRARAVELNGHLRNNATAANALFVTGAALLGAGVVIYLLSGDGHLAAAPSGLVVGGKLP